jgi:hypothetical protein
MGCVILHAMAQVHKHECRSNQAGHLEQLPCQPSLLALTGSSLHPTTVRTQTASGAVFACAPTVRVGLVTGTRCALPYIYRNTNRTDCVWADGVEACKVGGAGQVGWRGGEGK